MTSPEGYDRLGWLSLNPNTSDPMITNFHLKSDKRLNPSDPPSHTSTNVGVAQASSTMAALGGNERREWLTLNLRPEVLDLVLLTDEGRKLSKEAT